MIYCSFSSLIYVSSWKSLCNQEVISLNMILLIRRLQTLDLPGYPMMLILMYQLGSWGPSGRCHFS